MSIQPNNNNIVPSTNELGPSKEMEPPIESLPSEIMGYIFSLLKNEDIQSIASTKKNITAITVDQVKKNAASQIINFRDSLTAVIDQVCEELYKDNSNKTEIEKLKMIKNDISSINGQEVLGSINLLQIKTSTTTTKIAIAKAISNLPDLILDQFKKKERSSEISKDILSLSKLYSKIETFKSSTDNNELEKIAIKLAKFGDLSTAFKTAEQLGSNTAIEKFLRKFGGFENQWISDQLLDELLGIINDFPNSDFKSCSQGLISMELANRGSFDKSINILNKIPDDDGNIIFLIFGIIQAFTKKGEFEKAKELINNMNLNFKDGRKNEDLKREILKFISERRENQLILREFTEKGLIEKQQIDQLLKSIEKLTDSEKKLQVVTAAVHELVYNGFFKEAKKITKTLIDEQKRNSLLTFIKYNSTRGL